MIIISNAIPARRAVFIPFPELVVDGLVTGTVLVVVVVLIVVVVNVDDVVGLEDVVEEAEVVDVEVGPDDVVTLVDDTGVVVLVVV